MLTTIYRRIQTYWSMLKENNAKTILSYALGRIFNLRKLIELKINGETVFVITGTADLFIAQLCLGTEFRSL